MKNLVIYFGFLFVCTTMYTMEEISEDRPADKENLFKTVYSYNDSTEQNSEKTLSSSSRQGKKYFQAPIQATGLGFYAGFNKYLYGDGTTIIGEMIRGTFDTKHADNAGRFSRAIKEFVKAENLSSLAQLLYLCKKVAYKFEILTQLDVAYMFLQREQNLVEANTKSSIIETAKTCYPVIISKLNLLQTQLEKTSSDLIVSIEKQAKNIEAIFTVNQEKILSCKQARLNCLAINPEMRKRITKPVDYTPQKGYVREEEGDVYNSDEEENNEFLYTRKQILRKTELDNILPLITVNMDHINDQLKKCKNIINNIEIYKIQ